MRYCITCKRPINRGATGDGRTNAAHCLVCQTAAVMATLRYRPLYAPERRGPRRKAQ